MNYIIYNNITKNHTMSENNIVDIENGLASLVVNILFVSLLTILFIVSLIFTIIYRNSQPFKSRLPLVSIIQLTSIYLFGLLNATRIMVGKDKFNFEIYTLSFYLFTSFIFTTKILRLSYIFLSNKLGELKELILNSQSSAVLKQIIMAHNRINEKVQTLKESTSDIIISIGKQININSPRMIKNRDLKQERKSETYYFLTFLMSTKVHLSIMVCCTILHLLIWLPIEFNLFYSNVTILKESAFIHLDLLLISQIMGYLLFTLLQQTSMIKIRNHYGVKTLSLSSILMWIMALMIHLIIGLLLKNSIDTTLILISILEIVISFVIPIVSFTISKLKVGRVEISTDLVTEILTRKETYFMAFEHCKTEWSVNEIKFWKLSQDYELLTNDEEKKIFTKNLFNNFIANNSMFQINIEASTMNTAEEEIKTHGYLLKGTMKLLKLQCIINLSDIISRFIQTNVYKSWLEVNDLKTKNLK